LSEKANLASPTFSGTVKTANNTLDDGSGNAQVNGNLYLKSTSDNSDNTYIAKNDIISDLTELDVVIGDNGSGTALVAPSSGNTDYVAIKSTNIGIHHLFGTDGSYVSNGNAIIGGNLSVEGELGFNRNASNGTILNSNGHAYQFQHTASTTGTSDSLGLQVYNPSGTQVTPAALKINGIGAVNTANNTLDDGTGALEVVGTLCTSSGAFEHGSTSKATTPYIDFHSSGNNIDYDSRIVASGGSSTVGQGTINMESANFQANGLNVLRALSGGYKTQMGQLNVVVNTAGVATSTTVTFPTAFASNCTGVLLTILNTSTGMSGYIYIAANSATTTGFKIDANSYIAQTIAIQWLAIGI
jgi:hypothetical protein